MRIKRRQFLILGSLVGASPYLKAKENRQFEKIFQEVKPIIWAVQRHLFPSGSKIPSAESMSAIAFLYETIAHQSFDRDIRAFVIEGAKELQSREKGRFIVMTYQEKEVALRAYEETEYGSSWLARMMTLTMEGMFSDPVYGSNIKEAGWKAVGSFGGQPRPKKRYLDV